MFHIDLITISYQPFTISKLVVQFGKHEWESQDANVPLIIGSITAEDMPAGSLMCLSKVML